MIGLYYLVVLPVFWLFITWMIHRFWRRWKPAEGKRKHLYKVAGILLFSVWFGGTFWMVAGKKMYWDSKVRDLCAKDGGITVYETVELPAEMFNKWGQPNFYRPTQDENALGNDYIFVSEKTIYRMADPHVSRRIYKIFRKTDNKLLGKSIVYGRGGGDFPGPSYGSSFRCPEDRGGEITLLVNVFHTSKESKE